jgi:hypothetical protein
MSIVTVTPSGATTPWKGPDLCASGADTTNAKTRPAAWINVSIQALGPNGAGGCTPDAKGRMMHCLFRFSSPAMARRGKRRRPLGGMWPTGATVNSTLDVECDGGSPADPLAFWIGTPCSLFWIGGTPGDQYEVEVSENVPRDQTEREKMIDVEEVPFVFQLTSYFFVTGEGSDWINFPTPPPYYDDFEVVQGAARLAGPGGRFLPLDNNSAKPRVRLSSPQIQIQPGIYNLLGAV